MSSLVYKSARPHYWENDNDWNQSDLCDEKMKKLTIKTICDEFIGISDISFRCDTFFRINFAFLCIFERPSFIWFSFLWKQTTWHTKSSWILRFLSAFLVGKVNQVFFWRNLWDFYRVLRKFIEKNLAQILLLNEMKNSVDFSRQIWFANVKSYLFALTVHI